MRRGPEVVIKMQLPWGVIPLAQMAGDDDEDTRLLKVMAGGPGLVFETWVYAYVSSRRIRPFAFCSASRRWIS